MKRKFKQKYKKKDPENFIKDIKKYILDDRYIKINNKSIIGLYQPLLIPKLSETISIWRKKAREYGIGEIYILICLERLKIKKVQKLNLFDAAYDFPPRNNIIFKINKKKLTLFTTLIYKNINFSEASNDFPIFRGSMLEWDNSPRIGKLGKIFKEYSPEKFYILNKIIIEWTKANYNKTNRFIFVNAWNEWGEGSYLEPDEKYGYSSINALSKALFNLNYENYLNISNLFNSCKIAIQVHIEYENLIYEIINKTNNIPVDFDLLITTNSKNKFEIIESFAKKHSKARKLYIENIKIIKSKEKFLFTFLKQLKPKFKNYKYICLLKSKNIDNESDLDESIRYYLYDNLLGSTQIIKEILSYFENNSKLGLIFPEAFHKALINERNNLNKFDILYINSILQLIFPNHKYILRKIKDIPVGNMFWVKIDSIQQIFKLNLRHINGSLNNLIGIILLYLNKINGYYYKKIFKHF